MTPQSLALCQTLQLVESLAHPLRLKIVRLLTRQGEQSITQLAIQLRSSKPLVWLHLGKMKTNGLVTCRSVGNRHMYSLPDSPFIDQLLIRLDNFVQPL
ncbi:ArsR/SmtB family transcription factor [Spirosoma aerophilum]